MSELVSQLDNVSVSSPDRSMTPRPSPSVTSSTRSVVTSSNSITKTLHSISETPTPAQPTQVVRSDSNNSEKRYRQKSDELVRKPRDTHVTTSNLSRKESMNSSSSSVGFDANFPPPPSSAYEEQKEEVPEDIKITMQKIRHSSRDPAPEEAEIELIPEPATEKLPDAYFQPNFIADLGLKMRDDTPVSKINSSALWFA